MDTAVQRLGLLIDQNGFQYLLAFAALVLSLLLTSMIKRTLKRANFDRLVLPVLPDNKKVSELPTRLVGWAIIASSIVPIFQLLNYEANLNVFTRSDYVLLGRFWLSAATFAFFMGIGAWCFRALQRFSDSDELAGLQKVVGKGDLVKNVARIACSFLSHTIYVLALLIAFYVVIPSDGAALFSFFGSEVFSLLSTIILIAVIVLVGGIAFSATRLNEQQLSEEDRASRRVLGRVILAVTVFMLLTTLLTASQVTGFLIMFCLIAMLGIKRVRDAVLNLLAAGFLFADRREAIAFPDGDATIVAVGLSNTTVEREGKHFEIENATLYAMWREPLDEEALKALEVSKDKAVLNTSY
ncbi:hypothetical protein [Thaumasiovibrio subtropicus]|uniref:hypothetical protein n=1 Tax=Thaumasiovibrio subtropicus TaxID=1891207 RepID=UPI000B34DF28|nr:hypothetical protein [Thaumasiovibrio subtropicus]